MSRISGESQSRRQVNAAIQRWLRHYTGHDMSWPYEQPVASKPFLPNTCVFSTTLIYRFAAGENNQWYKPVPFTLPLVPLTILFFATNPRTNNFIYF
jgi:hypothetical protein